MTTKQTVLNYYSAIHAENWQDYISDKLSYGFNSAEQNLGKQDYLQGAGNFFNSTTNVELAHLVVEGDKAAVIARYTAKSPAGATQIFEVPEFLTVRDGKIVASSIYLDGAAFMAFIKGE
ncbi:nuclear transport factor 2 family protein [Rothia dentocariosa]|jgi:hypothetical protein|uniref:nuclear transport factor 2 family protein n=1 Tax=Rothia dentocariosa TaxID=2047 RepID=UPI001C576839|nr:nuclear transport factor 2 family protein [Rothia dentocariosa]QXT30245.1 nuclear transport factor 2 family protein [Rothia dentocariosa]